jgi:CRISPR-associated exonuclease Cas4
MDEPEEEITDASDDPVWLSMLEHYVYCPRQFALIHLESIYDDNIFTLKGSQAHERVDEPTSFIQDGMRCERALPLFCDQRGLTGIADLVEFPDGRPFPVEYKHSWRIGRRAAETQLWAQAWCLEEMFDCDVPQGAIYSIKNRRRLHVAIDDELRQLTEEALAGVREILRSQITPSAVND